MTEAADRWISDVRAELVAAGYINVTYTDVMRVMLAVATRHQSEVVTMLKAQV